MTENSHRRAAPDDHYWTWYLAGSITLWLAYLVVLMATVEGQSLWVSATDALANLLPPALIGIAAPTVLHRIKRLSPVALAGALAGLAIAYSLLWYVGIGLTLGLANIVQGEPFRIVWLMGVGRVWQVYQGMLLFALLIAFTAFWDARTEVVALREALRVTPQPPVTGEPQDDGPILLKADDGLRPVSAEDILAIEARDDSSTVILRTQRIATRTSLSHWEKQLPGDRFLRVHRSWIINVEQVLSFEPTGQGRMTAHLPTGVSAPVSRAGAKLVKSLLA